MAGCWLRRLWQRLTSVHRPRDLSEIKDDEVHAEARNAAQRYSSASRLVAIKASRDQKETRRMLDYIREEQLSVRAASSAVDIVERNRRASS